MGTANKRAYQRINQMAVEMVAYDAADINSHQVKKLQEQISIILFNLYAGTKKRYDDYGNEIRYFALVGKDVPNEVFTETLFALIGKNRSGQWFFRPEAASFVTAFKYRLEKNLLNYYDKNKRKSTLSTVKFTSLDENLESSDGIDGSRYELLEDESSVLEYDAVLNKIIGLGYIIDKYRRLTAMRSIKEISYYDGFFTFDTTKAIKSDSAVGDAACKHNDTLFPLFLISLLEYLMVGSFTQVRDVIENSLRQDIYLEQRGYLLESFFGVSHPTLSKFSKKYDSLKSAVLGELEM